MLCRRKCSRSGSGQVSTGSSCARGSSRSPRRRKWRGSRWCLLKHGVPILFLSLWSAGNLIPPSESRFIRREPVEWCPFRQQINLNFHQTSASALFYIPPVFSSGEPDWLRTFASGKKGYLVNSEKGLTGFWFSLRARDCHPACHGCLLLNLFNK